MHPSAYVLHRLPHLCPLWGSLEKVALRPVKLDISSLVALLQTSPPSPGVVSYVLL
uniref:Uncharacterized protein n=1 Tax=Anguilla anguilla TaxID=7936 RepID=A0A0E9P9S0_ANGAN